MKQHMSDAVELEQRRRRRRLRAYVEARQELEKMYLPMRLDLNTMHALCTYYRTVVRNICAKPESLAAWQAEKRRLDTLIHKQHVAPVYMPLFDALCLKHESILRAAADQWGSFEVGDVEGKGSCFYAAVLNFCVYNERMDLLIGLFQQLRAPNAARIVAGLTRLTSHPLDGAQSSACCSDECCYYVFNDGKLVQDELILLLRSALANNVPRALGHVWESSFDDEINVLALDHDQRQCIVSAKAAGGSREDQKQRFFENYKALLLTQNSYATTWDFENINQHGPLVRVSRDLTFPLDMIHVQCTELHYKFYKIKL